MLLDTEADQIGDGFVGIVDERVQEAVVEPYAALGRFLQQLVCGMTVEIRRRYQSTSIACQFTAGA